MPRCPGCGAQVSDEGIYCRDCIVKNREKAMGELRDFDDLLDSLEELAEKPRAQPADDKLIDLVEDTLLDSLRKIILGYSDAEAEYQLSIASDAVEKLIQYGPDAKPVLVELQRELRQGTQHQVELATMIQDELLSMN
ncbi:hypothetical protein JXL21_03185 [Candidatus Bathyarchaeota archaeon]|nr:hypothetical protein [Candidatus Bathyarchaeota archaeon]